MSRYLAVLLILPMLLFWGGVAVAQDCAEFPGSGGTFSLCYQPHTPTPTWEPTPTPDITLTSEPEPTTTPTPTPIVSPTSIATETLTPTASPAPTDTAISTPTPSTGVTATSTPFPSVSPTPTVTAATPEITPSPVPAVGLRVNVPLLDIQPPNPAYDANHYAVTWLGKVVDSTYTDVRLLGGPDGLRIRLQMIDESLTDADAVTVQVGAWQHTVSRRNPGPFAIDYRCTGDACRGWGATATVPWTMFGNRPTPGEMWPMTVTRSGGATWDGSVRWGEPGYLQPVAGKTSTIIAPVIADATVGGSTDCGAPDWPDYFPTWGSRNWGASPYAIAQNQWDIADWPCYAKQVLRWDLSALPDGAQVVSATLTMYHFGDPGYGDGEADDGTGTTVFQVYEMTPGWSEMGITWDTLTAGENVSRATVRPVPKWCNRFCNPPIPEAFDVTELTRRALASGQTTADAAIYTAAGQYHSGKQFWSRESNNPPVVEIIYATESRPTPTTQPPVVATATPTATPTPIQPSATPQPTPTNTPTVPPPATATVQPSPTPSATRQPSPTPTPTPRPGGVAGKTLYIAPGQPYPWAQLLPGDTLILRDGIYPPMRPNVRNGEPGKPIIIRAENDGGAIIDGKGKTAIQLGDTWPALGPDAAWWVLDGIVARNGGESVISIRGHDIILRRVSAYDADPDGNSSIIWPYYSKNILIEDCIAAGTGRKTITIFSSEDVTIRRCYSDWKRWDGLTFCGVPWPGGNGIHIYNGHRIRVENSISLGPVPDRSLAITNQSDTATMTGIEVLGSIAAGAGRTTGGAPYPYPFPGAGQCGNDAVYQFYPGENAGLVVYGQGPIIAPVFRDVLATNNANEGFGIIRPYGTGGQDVILDHATLFGNGMNLRPDSELAATNICIGAQTCGNGGARLTHRYIDGQLTDIPLLPFPMEMRGRDELGISISDIWAGYAGE